MLLKMMKVIIMRKLPIIPLNEPLEFAQGNIIPKVNSPSVGPSIIPRKDEVVCMKIFRFA